MRSALAIGMNIEVLCAAPPEALPHSPRQMPLSCPVAPDRPSTAKTLTDDCSALYWTQELGLICLESERRAASNEPSCFSALKPDRMGAERARLLNKEQRRPFIVRSVSQIQIISCITRSVGAEALY